MLLVATPAAAASFDCGRARAPDEKAICANRALNDKDVKMTTMLVMEEHLLAMGGRDAMKDDQREWLHQRQTCKGNVKCLAKAYDDRLETLQKSFDEIASHGPF